MGGRSGAERGDGTVYGVETLLHGFSAALEFENNDGHFFLCCSGEPEQAFCHAPYNIPLKLLGSIPYYRTGCGFAENIFAPRLVSGRVGRRSACSPQYIKLYGAVRSFSCPSCQNGVRQAACFADVLARRSKDGIGCVSQLVTQLGRSARGWRPGRPGMRWPAISRSAVPEGGSEENPDGQRRLTIVRIFERA